MTYRIYEESNGVEECSLFEDADDAIRSIFKDYGAPDTPRNREVVTKVLPTLVTGSEPTEVWLHKADDEDDGVLMLVQRMAPYQARYEELAEALNLDQFCEVEDGPSRFALVEFDDREHWLTTHESLEEAGKYVDSNEGDWNPYFVYDLETGDVYHPRTLWEKDPKGEWPL